MWRITRGLQPYHSSPESGVVHVVDDLEDDSDAWLGNMSLREIHRVWQEGHILLEGPANDTPLFSLQDSKETSEPTCTSGNCRRIRASCISYDIHPAVPVIR